MGDGGIQAAVSPPTSAGTAAPSEGSSSRRPVPRAQSGGGGTLQEKVVLATGWDPGLASAAAPSPR